MREADGLPLDAWTIPVSDTQAYKQFGNSVVIPVIKAVAELMLPEIHALQRYDATGILGAARIRTYSARRGPQPNAQLSIRPRGSRLHKL